jgi:hypothetical protein
MKAASSVRVPVRASSSAGRAGGQHLAVVHGHQPVEALGLVHVGGGHQHAHARALARMRAISPRTGRAPAGRRRWWARRGSAGRGRGSARSTGRASASCRPRACPPGARGKGAAGAARVRSSMRRRARPRRGRTGGRRTAGSLPPTAWGRGSCPGPAACRRCAGRPRRGGGAGHVAAQHLDLPCCTARAPAISASRLDLPTPSGPISPTMRPAGHVQRDAGQRHGLAVAQATPAGGRRAGTCVMAGRQAWPDSAGQGCWGRA